MRLLTSSPASSIFPRHGVVTLFGYGIQARVDRGHLILEDGIGAARRQGRLPRVGHGLRRLVVIGADGMVSLAALRWLADQDAAFVMLDRDGSVLATTGPVRPSDARLRRAQALAGRSDAGLRIVRELIGQKLTGQARVAKDKLLNSRTAQTIFDFRDELATAETPESIRLIESQAGAAYWSAWHNLAINFPRNDLRRVPDHWRVFGTRISPLSGSPRSAGLTQRHRREAKGNMNMPSNRAPRPQNICRVCGTSIEVGKTYCALCGVTISRGNLAEAAKSGRVVAQSPEAQERRANTKRWHDIARRGWLASSQPAWLTNETYLGKIQPRLARITYSVIASQLGVSLPYAADIRAGRRCRHPRHWQTLARVVGVSPETPNGPIG
jgi:hypothetical protein